MHGSLTVQFPLNPLKKHPDDYKRKSVSNSHHASPKQNGVPFEAVDSKKCATAVATDHHHTHELTTVTHILFCASSFVATAKGAG